MARISSGVDQIMNQLQTQFIPVAPAASNDNAPVFILGMFRTGSTLLEQILAAHPRFQPLGESEFWPREVHSLGGGMIKPGSRPNGTQQAESHARWRGALAERRVPRWGEGD